MKHNILITGGSGFIGTHLRRALAQEAHVVHSLDLVDPEERFSEQHLRGDACDPNTLRPLVQKVDTVFHLAAIASVPKCQENPLGSYRTNLLSTAVLLEEIAQERMNSDREIRLIFSSTSAVYGEQTLAMPTQEDQPLQHPLSFYAAQKTAVEYAIRLFHTEKKIPAIILRFFNVYGPGQKLDSQYSGVISRFKHALGQSNPLHLYGGGKQTRDFVSVHEVVRACLLALDIETKYCDAKPMNIASGHSTSIRELAELMQNLSGRRVPCEDLPARGNDIEHSLADISRAKAVLGWEPKIMLSDGLRELLSS